MKKDDKKQDKKNAPNVQLALTVDANEDVT